MHAGVIRIIYVDKGAFPCIGLYFCLTHWEFILVWFVPEVKFTHPLYQSWPADKNIYFILRREKKNSSFQVGTVCFVFYSVLIFKAVYSSLSCLGPSCPLKRQNFPPNPLKCWPKMAKFLIDKVCLSTIHTDGHLYVCCQSRTKIQIQTWCNSCGRCAPPARPSPRWPGWAGWGPRCSCTSQGRNSSLAPPPCTHNSQIFRILLNFYINIL